MVTTDDLSWPGWPTPERGKWGPLRGLDAGGASVGKGELLSELLDPESTQEVRALIATTWNLQSLEAVIRCCNFSVAFSDNFFCMFDQINFCCNVQTFVQCLCQRFTLLFLELQRHTESFSFVLFAVNLLQQLKFSDSFLEVRLFCDSPAHCL